MKPVVLHEPSEGLIIPTPSLRLIVHVSQSSRHARTQNTYKGILQSVSTPVIN